MFADFLRIFGFESVAKPELTDELVRANPISWVSEQCYVPQTDAFTPQMANAASLIDRDSESATVDVQIEQDNWKQLMAFDDIRHVVSQPELQSTSLMNQAIYLDSQALEHIKYDADQDAALREVSRQFEALFVQELLKRMRSATEALGNEDNPLSNNSNSMFQSMLDNQLAMSVTQQSSFGLADLLYQQLSGQNVRNV